jgi:hypothetical protein
MAQSAKRSKDILKRVRRGAGLGKISAPAGGLGAVELKVSEATSLEEFTRKMAEPMADERVFFNDRKRLGLGVGTDASGHLVYAKDRGTV